MEITDAHIKTWTDTAEAPVRLPSLVKKLIIESTPGLVKIDIPETTAINVGGVDGIIENSSETLNVPDGISYWEFSNASNAEKKFWQDYEKRTLEFSPKELKSSSFIFVTTRRFKNRRNIENKLEKDSSWAEVRLYDSEKLASWINECRDTKNWFINQFDIPSTGILTAEEWWTNWATTTKPHLSKSLVAKRHFNKSSEFLSRIANQDPKISIVADSKEEAIAFAIATILEDSNKNLISRVQVVRTKDAYIEQSRKEKPILILDIPDEKVLHVGDHDKFIIVYPYHKGELLNTNFEEQSIVLTQIPAEHFNNELINLGFSKQKAEELIIKSGKSIVALRRLLSNKPSLKQNWLGTKDETWKLIPFFLCGSWIDDIESVDYSILELIGNTKKNKLIKIQENLLAMENSPLQKLGNFVVVNSQFDALISAGFALNEKLLKNYFDIVSQLLVEENPVLNVYGEEWFKKNISGVEKNYSQRILTGLCKSLCILANNDDLICGDSNKLDISMKIDQLVESIFENIDSKRWLSIREHLTYLAESSPQSFLEGIENDLQKENPEIIVLMKSVDDGFSEHCLRSHLLWSLEILAWHERYFKRVVEILFKLQQFELKDGRTNSSFETAKNLFRVWLPSTEVSIQKRFEILRELGSEYRIPVLDICISLLPKRYSPSGTRTESPKWRLLENDVPKVNDKNVQDSYEKSQCFLIELAPYNAVELKRILKVIAELELKHINELAKEVKSWAKNADDNEKSEVLDILRISIKYIKSSYSENTKSILTTIERIDKYLQPRLPNIRHRWLFKEKYLDWNLLFDYSAVNRPKEIEIQDAINDLRINAIYEIKQKQGQEAMLDFIFNVNRPDIVAMILCPNTVSTENRSFWIGKILDQPHTLSSKYFIQGAFCNLNEIEISKILENLKNEKKLQIEENKNLIVESLPANKIGWKIAKKLGADTEQIFWTKVDFEPYFELSSEDFEYIVNKLVQFGKSNSAFSFAGPKLNEMPSKTLKLILTNLIKENTESEELPESYSIVKAFEVLDNDLNLTVEEIAKIEFPYLPFLLDYGLNNSDRVSAWHRLISDDPNYLKEVLIWGHPREDGTNEPYFKNCTYTEIQKYTNIAFQLFLSWNLVPGENNEGMLDERKFDDWVAKAYTISEEISRLSSFENHLCNLIVKYAKRYPPADWLPNSMLKLLEQKKNLRTKLLDSIYYARGRTVREAGEGGVQERDLAKEYDSIASKIKSKFPEVADELRQVAKMYKDEASIEDDQVELYEH